MLQNTEAWESEKTLDDMEKYFWDINKSRTKMISLIKARKEVDTLDFVDTCTLMYTVSGKKEATLFSTTTLAFLSRFL